MYVYICFYLKNFKLSAGNFYMLIWSMLLRISVYIFPKKHITNSDYILDLTYKTLFSLLQL